MSESSKDKAGMLWKGTPVEELSREELLKAAYYLANENRRVRQERDMWMDSRPISNYPAKKTGAI